MRSLLRSLCTRLRSAAPSLPPFAHYCTHCCTDTSLQQCACSYDANANTPPRPASRSPARATADAQDNAPPGREHAPPPAAPLPGFVAGRLLTSWRRPRDLLPSKDTEEEFWRTATNRSLAPRGARRRLLSQSRALLRPGEVESRVARSKRLREVEIHRRVLGLQRHASFSK